MTPLSHPSASANELSALYELSLAAGGELDLGETCRRFLDLLKARGGVDYAAVWVRRELMPGAGKLTARQRDGFGLAYASPASRAATASISALHPLVQRSEDAPWSLVAADEQAFGQLVMEREVDGGAYVVYRLRDVGLLKLYVSAAGPQPSPARVEQFRGVVDRFGAAVEVCLDHQLLIEEHRLRRESDRRAEAELRLESMGRLAGGVAEQFGALVSTILERAEPLRGLGGAATHAVDWIVDSATRAQRLCGQLSEFAEPAGRAGVPSASRSLRDLDEVVGEVLLRAAPDMPEGVRVVRELDGALPVIRCDEVRLRRALSALLTNAVDAAEHGGGVVTLRTMREHLRRSDLAHYRIGASQHDGDYVCLEVEDLGAGMDEETKAAMFEPFSGRGRGAADLGLAAALGIIRRHGGAVAVESAPGAGTCVRVLLPAAGSRRVSGSLERAELG